MRNLVVFFLLIAVFSSCDENRIYDKNVDFEKRYWLANEKPEFEFEITDSLTQYSLYCNIRNSVSFPFSRLFINYSLEDSSGRSLEKKLTSAYLFDQKTGKPFGDSGLGDIYDQRVPLITNYQFKHSGKFKIRLEQYMRLDTLEGILAVGVRVEKKQ